MRIRNWFAWLRQSTRRQKALTAPETVVREVKPKPNMERAIALFEHPAFRRNIPLPEERKKALKFLSAKLTKDKTFFKSLKVLLGNQSLSENVRVFDYAGISFVIKDTQNYANHGYAGENGYLRGSDLIRQFIKRHHAHVRKNKRNSLYILRTTQVFEQIGQYLVMEHIKHWIPQTRVDKRLFDRALEQMVENFITIHNQGDKLYKFIPQVHDFIPAGIYNGKVVFYAVRDYT